MPALRLRKGPRRLFNFNILFKLIVCFVKNFLISVFIAVCEVREIIFRSTVMPWKYAQMKLPKLINSTIFENNFFLELKVMTNIEPVGCIL